MAKIYQDTYEYFKPNSKRVSLAVLEPPEVTQHHDIVLLRPVTLFISSLPGSHTATMPPQSIPWLVVHRVQERQNFMRLRGPRLPLVSANAILGHLADIEEALLEPVRVAGLEVLRQYAIWLWDWTCLSTSVA